MKRSRKHQILATIVLVVIIISMLFTMFASFLL